MTGLRAQLAAVTEPQLLRGNVFVANHTKSRSDIDRVMLDYHISRLNEGMQHVTATTAVL